MPSYFLTVDRESDQRAPHVAMLANGRLALVWDSLRGDAGIGGSYGTFMSVISDSFRRRYTEERAIHQESEGIQRSPRVTALDDGGYAVVWESDGPSARSGVDDGYYDSYIRFFDADGTPRGGEMQMHAQRRNDTFVQDVTTLADGSVVAVVAKHSGGAVYDLVAHRYSEAGRLLGSRTLERDVDLIGTDAGFYRQPGARIVEDGRGYLMTWTGEDDGYHVFAQRFGADGGTRGRAVQVSRDSADWHPQDDAEATRLADGGFAVAWDRREEDIFAWDVYLRFLDGRGRPTGGPVLVNRGDTSGAQTVADVVDLGGGKALVTYISERGDGAATLRGRVFDAADGALGRQFRISEFAMEEMAGGNSILRSDGRLVSVWQAKTAEGIDIIGSVESLPRLEIEGTGRRDRLVGSNIRDDISGGPGADRLEGLGADDQLKGGAGADTFVFARGWGSDRILDFRPDTDRIDFRATGFDRLAEVRDAMRLKRGDTVIDGPGNDSVTLGGVRPGELDAGDFLF